MFHDPVLAPELQDHRDPDRARDRHADACEPAARRLGGRPPEQPRDPLGALLHPAADVGGGDLDRLVVAAEPVLRAAARAALALRRSRCSTTAILFSSPATAIGVLTFVGMWQWTPFHTLIYQGGARAIPEVLYQAAAIDGAGRVRQFFYITLPQLRNTMITSIVLMLVGGLTTFDTILILTQGRPGTSTTSTSYYMYDEGVPELPVRCRRASSPCCSSSSTTLISLILVRASGWDKMRSTQEGV